MDKKLQKIILEIIKVNNGQAERRHIFNKTTRQYWKKEPSPETNVIIKHQLDLLEKRDKIIRDEIKITREDGLGDTIYILTPSGHQEFDSFLEKTLGKKYKGSMVELRDHPKLDQKLRRQYVNAIEKAPWKKDFMGVQCENCHSPRGVKDALGKDLLHQVESELPKKVVADLCLKCHTPSQSPKFNFEKDRRILGEKDAKAPFHCKLKDAP